MFMLFIVYKKVLVYKTELTFKISENHHFFQLFFTSPPIVNGFFLLVEGRNATQLLCFHVLLHMLLPYFQFIARII